MYERNFKQITFILYDGVENAAFATQVRAPLLAMLEANKNLEITLISFEKGTIAPDKLKKLIPSDDRLHFIIARKYPFIGRLSLYPATEQLKRILSYIPCDHLIARGPLAGLIVLNALKKKCLDSTLANCTDNALCLPYITIQARGLAAEEYRFTHKGEISFLKKLITRYICNQLEKIEQEVFSTRNYSAHKSFFEIEAISPSLKEHLADHYNADNQLITIADSDHPQPFEIEQLVTWKAQTRNELNIPLDASVYCYSGSAQPWQCGPETILYFKEQLKHNPHAILLIISPDKKAFEEMILQSALPIDCYRLLSIKKNELPQYLAAADYGMLFRQNDIINWVSRPTKMLEYKAAGLKIIHNNTIGWLVNKT